MPAVTEAARQVRISSAPRTDVLGVGISAVSLDAATSTILDWVRSRERNYVTVTGVHGVVEAQSDPHLKGILNQAGLNVPDGMPMVWLSWWAGNTHVTRVFGPDLMLSVSERLAELRASAFYYGGKPGVAAELAAILERSFPGLRTAGALCPPFQGLGEVEQGRIEEEINAAEPDVVWVGLSTPKQEKWMGRARPGLRAPVLVGVGAAFDYNTGRIRRAPSSVQRAGLEWAYRTLQDPRRLWMRYAKNNSLFAYYLVRELLGLRQP